MTELLKGVETDPTWASPPSKVRLYDGNPFLTVSADVIPGFIALELTNRTCVSLLWVTCTVTPVKEEMRLLTRWTPTSIPPASSRILPIAYTSSEPCECSILVTFRRGVEGAGRSKVHVCQTRVLLVPSPEQVFQEPTGWRSLIPRLTRREILIPPGWDLSRNAILEALGTFLGGKLVPTSSSRGEVPISWGCKDPLFLVTFGASPSAPVVVYGADVASVDRIIADFPKWNQAGIFRGADFYELGVACTTLRDGLEMRTKAEYVRPAGRQVTRLAGTLGLQVPLLSRLLDLLAIPGSLGDLTESERALYEQALVEVETQVMGRPS